MTTKHNLILEIKNSNWETTPRKTGLKKEDNLAIIENFPVTIGSIQDGANPTIIINVNDDTISKKHAVFAEINDCINIWDQNSKKGLIIIRDKEAKIIDKKPYALQKGDKIILTPSQNLPIILKVISVA